jgi:hypothetical protein
MIGWSVPLWPVGADVVSGGVTFGDSQTVALTLGLGLIAAVISLVLNSVPTAHKGARLATTRPVLHSR